MSLLQKASIITTPTAYAEDYLYSIKPALSLGAEEITNGNFSVSGTINATSFSLGFASSDTGGTFTISNQQVTLARVNGSTRLRGTNGVDSLNFLTSGKKYRLVYNVISNNGASAFYYYNGSTGVAAPSTVGQHTIDYTSAGTQFYLETQNNGSNITLDGISIKEVTDADFDFTRNSTGTRLNEDYLIEDVPYNLFTYSEQIDSSDWDKVGTTVIANDLIAPDGTLSADKVNENAGGTYHNVNWDGLVENGLTYTVSVFFKSGERTNANIYENVQSGSLQISSFNLSTGEVISQDSAHTAKIESAGKNWFRCSITFTPNARRTGSVYLGVNDSMIYTGVADNGVYMWGAQLVKGDQPKDYLKTTDRLDIPRIDYTNGEPSILLEPSRTNLETKSNEFSTWGVISNTTRTANYTQSPEGLNNATRLQFTANGYVANTPQILGTYTISCYAKRNDSGTQNVGFFTNGSGVVNSAWAVTSEWKRFSYTFPTLNGSYMGIAGVSGADISVYGFQIEGLVSYATSYIPTSGSTVTRSADSANNAGNSDLINSTEGVLYAEFKGQNDNTFNYISVSDGGTTNYAAILCSDVDNEIAYRYYVSNSGVQILTSVSNLLEFNKIAVKWKVNDFSIYINGVQVGASTSGSVNSAGTFNNVSFARGTSNNTPFYGNFKSVMVFKEALTDLELEKLTGYNNHELYMNYYNRLSYLGLVEEYNVESDINNYIL